MRNIPFYAEYEMLACIETRSSCSLFYVKLKIKHGDHAKYTFSYEARLMFR
jgi:hypothetical protein